MIVKISAVYPDKFRTNKPMETDERFVRVVRIVVGGSLGWPQSFVGPAANLSRPATLRVSVLPPAFATGWAGVGIGGQTKKNTDVGLHPDNATLAVWGNGSWCCLGSCGALAPLPRTMTTTWGNAPRWFELSVSLSLDATGQQVLVASIDGTIVAHGVVSLGGGSGGEAYANPFVAASYSTAAGNNATKSDSPAVRSHSLPAFLPVF
jgi:hypothetical protein